MTMIEVHYGDKIDRMNDMLKDTDSYKNGLAIAENSKIDITEDLYLKLMNTMKSKNVSLFNAYKLTGQMLGVEYDKRTYASKDALHTMTVVLMGDPLLKGDVLL